MNQEDLIKPLFVREAVYLKYEDIIRKVKELKPGEFTLYFYEGSDIKDERQRLATNIKYHVPPSKGFRYAFKCVLVVKDRAISIRLLKKESS